MKLALLWIGRKTDVEVCVHVPVLYEITTEPVDHNCDLDTGFRANQPVDSTELILPGARFNPPEHCVSLLHGDLPFFHRVIRGLRRQVDSSAS